MVDIVARKSLSYAGKRIAAGQTFPATQTHAKLLIRLGKAAMAKSGDATPEEQSGSDPTPEASLPEQSGSDQAPEAQTQPNRKKSKKELKKEREAYSTRALTAETGKSG